MKVIEMQTDAYGETVPCLTQHAFAYHCTDVELGLKPNTRYAVIAVRIPENYRLVTEEEKQKYSKPLEARCKSAPTFIIDGWYDVTSTPSWNPDVLYAIPFNHVWEEDKPKKKPVTLELTDDQLEKIKEILKEK